MPVEDLVIDPPVIQEVEQVVADEQQEQVADEQQADAEDDAQTLPAYIRAMKDVDHEKYRTLKADFYTKKAEIDTFNTRVKRFGPEGVKEVDAVLNFLEEHGGREGLTSAIGELKGKAEQLDGILQAVQAGDRTVVESIAEASPEGFPKIAEATLEKWASADPESYTRSLSGIFDATMRNSEVPLNMAMMGYQLDAFRQLLSTDSALSQNPHLVTLYNQLAGQFGKIDSFTKSFGQAAQQAATPKNGKPNEVQTAKAEAEVIRQQTFDSTVERDLEAWRTPEITKELQTFISRRKDDVDARELAISTVRSQVIARLGGDKDFTGKANAFLRARDKAGYDRLVRSRESSVIREIAPKVGRMIFGNPAPVKAATPPEVRRQASVPTAPRNKFDEIWNSV